MTGFVTLVGAGPGNEDLITIKGLERIKEADVIVYDRLVNPALLRFAKKGCEQINVGKIPGQTCVSQEAIEAILVEKAQENKRVVRLKSGDPYIFGRGGEEGMTLFHHAIPFEVVPGVTSAIAGLAYAGVPATYRDIATSLHIITGHLQDANESLNWSAIAQLKGTLVFLMGMKNLPIISEELINNGYAKDTPVAIVEWGTHDKQRSIDGTLANIVDLVSQHQFGAPSVIVVGEVVKFREQLNVYEQLPLFKQRVLVQDSSTGKLPRLLKEKGATLLTFPARDEVIAETIDLPDFSNIKGVVVTDSYGWQLVMQQLVEKGMDIRQLASINIITVGHHTTKLIKQAGINPTHTLTHWQTEQIKDLLQDGNWLVLAEKTRESLLKEAGQPVLVTHQMVASKPFSKESAASIDMICLPNSVAAETFVLTASQHQLEQLKQLPIVIMGNATRSVLEKAGFTNLVETEEATIASMVETSIQLVK